MIRLKAPLEMGICVESPETMIGFYRDVLGYGFVPNKLYINNDISFWNRSYFKVAIIIGNRSRNGFASVVFYHNGHVGHRLV